MDQVKDQPVQLTQFDIDSFKASLVLIMLVCAATLVTAVVTMIVVIVK